MSNEDPIAARSAAEPPAAPTQTWRELAVARSLDPARVRAENRVQRYLDAALEVLNDEPGKDFTVQDVVERSGQSLRGFYQYFTGKHELLLALFEEAIATTAEHLRTTVGHGGDPLERLHLFVGEYYRLCSLAPGDGAAVLRAPASVVAEFAHQLLTRQPKEAAEAFTPLMLLFEQLLDEAADAGVIRPDLHHRELAGVVLQSVMFHSFAQTIRASGSRPDREESETLWDLLLLGIGSPRS
jgi:AcrR family transcriptional regulator